MTEPTSTDPLEWAVFSDYLFDCGDEEGSRRARHISRALRLYPGGKLWLTPGRCSSGVHLDAKRGIDRSRVWAWLDDPECYQWQTDKPYVYEPGYQPLCPLDWPMAFADPVGKALLAKYWQTLERLGEEVQG